VVELSVLEIAELVRSSSPSAGRTIVGITGPPGVGKSTLVESLAAALVPLVGAVAVVAMDGFHLANAELERLGRRDRKGAPDTFDGHGYAALLSRLRANEEPVVYAPRFDRDIDESIGSAVAVARDVRLVLTEGNYLLADGEEWAAARAQLDAVWYLDLPEATRVARLAARHERYGLSAAEARRRATIGPDGGNARLVEATRDRADRVLRLR
jgi:pantothenate kinase